MKYDDASWHYGGDFPSDLPDSAGAIHIAMFVVWTMLNGLAGELHVVDYPEDLVALRDRAMTPAQWFIEACDEKFTAENLNEEGNAFARAYYGEDGNLKTDAGSYLDDYSEAFPDGDSLYHVPDTWAAYAVLEPIIRRRFDLWRAAR